LNQGELSKALSVAGNTVSRWELGTRAIPSFLPLALETIERRLSESTAGSKTVSTVGSVDNKSNSTAGSKPKSIEKKSTVGSSDLSATDNENEYTMTTADAGKALDLKPRTVREYAEKGLLKGKQGKQNHWFFRSWDVGEFQMTRGKE
jgi:hypothetical protein